jgi:uncharacterized membrane protein YbhN (UPF0104 family)
MESAEPTIQVARRPAWLQRVILIAIAVLATVAIARLIGRIEWSSVWQALAHLSWWQPCVLMVVLIGRQVLNAAPLAFYIPGVSLYRATVNDLGATVMSALAPPPSDMALRVAMFTSWSVNTTTALAGTVMNTLTFFITRFSAPLFGFGLVLITNRPIGFRWLDVISLVIAATLLACVLLVVRTESWARRVGFQCGRLACKVRRTIDPQAWADACARFRDDIAERFSYAFPRSLSTSFLMLAADATILLLALRFVGVGPDQVTVIALAIAYLFAFPLTAFPMSGLGVVDVLILAALVEAGGDAVQEPAVAAMIIWRLFTVAGPWLLGIIAVTLWRRSSRRTGPDFE